MIHRDCAASEVILVAGIVEAEGICPKVVKDSALPYPVPTPLVA